MQFTTAILTIGAASAFTPSLTSRATTQLQSTPSTTVNTRPVYDPLGLYPSSSEERANGLIQALESSIALDDRPVLDPLKLYSSSATTANLDTSDSLPFLPRPIALDRTMAGDVGFDPFNLSGGSKEQLNKMRDAEIKHARLAMLAAVGWPVSEVYHTALAKSVNLTPLLGHGDKVPSLLNGGLEMVSPIYWLTILAVAGTIEGWASTQNGSVPGDLGFDPLNLYPKDAAGQQKMQLAEIKHGRLAMMAITGYAVQELFTNMGVIHELPFFH